MQNISLLTSENFPFLNYVSGGMMLLVIFVFAVSIFLKMQLVLKTEWTFCSYLELFGAFSCLLVVAMYLYLFLNLITGDTSNITTFGIIVVRPVLFLLGASITSQTRFKVTHLEQGGIRWTLRKSKT